MNKSLNGRGREGWRDVPLSWSRCWKIKERDTPLPVHTHSPHACARVRKHTHTASGFQPSTQIKLCSIGCADNIIPIETRQTCSLISPNERCYGPVEVTDESSVTSRPFINLK